MILEKIKYSQEFVTSTGLKRWVGLEAAVEFGDDPGRSLTALKVIAEDWYKAQGEMPDPEVVFGKMPTLGQEVALRFSLEKDINSCTDIKVLETYKLLVKNNEHLQQVYEKKLAELKK